MLKQHVKLEPMTQFKPDHAETERLLQSAGVEQSAAEAHGMLCGMLCSDVSDWRPALLEKAGTDDPTARDAEDQLQQLWSASRTELKERRMPLHLLLPEDDRPVEERATAIRDWCQGFLYGFGLGGAQKPALFESEAGEALRDFGEIARLALGEFGDDQEAEEALMQLQEYLWVATSLIWHETHDDQK